MKAGKSTGKRPAAISAKKGLRGKKASPAPPGITKKKSASARKVSSATPAPAAKTTVRKKPSVAEKAKGSAAAGSRKAAGLRAKAAAPKPQAEAKKTPRRAKAASPKDATAAAARRKKGRTSTRKTAGAAPVKGTAARARKAVGPRIAYPAKKTTAVMPDELPFEYGEDDITAIVVDPHEVFAYWELGKDHFRQSGERLILRIEDAGAGVSGLNARSNDIPIYQRVGSGFFPLGMQGGHAILILGTIGPGGLFRPIVSTGRMAVPVCLPEGDDTIGEKPSGERIGYQ